MSDIAVLLPVYKGDLAKYFEQALLSVIHQSYSPIDIILLQDGPIDSDMAAIIRKHSTSIKKTIAFNENHGLAWVLNRGLEYCFDAGYEYIARMDADDISEPDRFQKQFDFLLNHPDIDVVGGAVREIDENGVSSGKTIYYPNDHDGCFNFFKKRDPLAHPAVLFRKNFFLKAGLYDETYRKNQDTQLWFKGFLNNCRFSNIPDVILDLRLTSDFYHNRRAGWQRALTIYKQRNLINKQLHYGMSGKLYALVMLLITISPAVIRRNAYRLLR